MAAKGAIAKGVGARTRIVGLVFIGARDGKPAKIQLKRPEDEIVKIDVNESLGWAVEPANTPLWIVFQDRTPFDKHAYLSTIDGFEPRRPLLRGYFKYHVVWEADRSVRLDPGIVVDPPPYP